MIPVAFIAKMVINKSNIRCKIHVRSLLHLVFGDFVYDQKVVKRIDKTFFYCIVLVEYVFDLRKPSCSIKPHFSHISQGKVRSFLTVIHYYSTERSHKTRKRT